MITDLTRTCAKCGQAKPLSEFDHRFIHKDTNVWCLPCREARRQYERDRWSDPAYQARIARELLRIRQEQQRLYEEERQRLSEEWRRAYEERKRLVYTWIRQRSTQELEDRDCYLIELRHSDIHRSGLTWSEIKQRFQVLNPPYVGSKNRSQVTKGTRLHIYQSQQGKCYYCARELAPLGTHVIPYKDRSDGWEDNYHWDNYPEIDHLIPVSRGGTNDLENLCYVCRKCNLRKTIRTAAEFALMPEDAISKLPFHPLYMCDALQYESQGYTGFEEKWPFDKAE